MTHPMHDEKEDAIERAMYQRLGREHGITDTTCPKCLHYRLRRVAPQLELPLSFGYTLGPHTFHWLKERMDAYAKAAPRIRLRWQDAQPLLQQSGHDPAHLDHIPAEARLHAVYVMHVQIPGVGDVPVIADGQHRTTLAVRERRDLVAIVLGSHIEPRCRVTASDERQREAIAQEHGLLTWEIPIQYAVYRRDAQVVFGRMVMTQGAARDDPAFFEAAQNAPALARTAATLAPRQGPTLLRGLIAGYATLSRQARFLGEIRLQGQRVPVRPLTRDQIDANPAVLVALR